MSHKALLIHVTAINNAIRCTFLLVASLLHHELQNMFDYICTRVSLINGMEYGLECGMEWWNGMMLLIQASFYVTQ